MKHLLIRCAALFAALLLLSAVPLTAFSAEAPPAAGFQDPAGPIVGIANKGLWTEYPENSLEGIRAAAKAGLSLILTDVSRTSDGVLVLLASDAAGRMLDAGQQETAGNTYGDLAALPLKNGVGGKGNPATEYRIATLEAALTAAASEGFALVLKCDVSLAPEITALLREKNAGSRAILYFTGKQKAVLEAARTYGGEFPLIAEKRSNVIFAVTSFLDSLQQADAAGAVLKTTNRYGVIYYPGTLRRCKTLRAVADTGNYKTAGYREDTVKWWDDLIGRGYSAVITDDPAAFAAYLRDNEEARQRLAAKLDEAKNAALPVFKNPLFNDYKKAYTDAVSAAEALLADQSSSLMAMRDCHTSLTSAMKELRLHFDEIETGTAGSTVSVRNILLCVGAAAAVIAAQIFFYKRRKTA